MKADHNKRARTVLRCMRWAICLSCYAGGVYSLWLGRYGDAGILLLWAAAYAWVLYADRRRRRVTIDGGR